MSLGLCGLMPFVSAKSVSVYTVRFEDERCRRFMLLDSCLWLSRPDILVVHRGERRALSGQCSLT